MKIIDILRKQHKEILDSIQSIKPLLIENNFILDIIPHINEILSLIGKIAAHISIEESTFYKELLQYENLASHATIKRFMGEAAEINEVFNTYQNTWKNLSIIQINTHHFLEETKNFISLISKRIDKEEYDLFVLVDSLTHE